MSWLAKELGINLEELESERFTHPIQVALHRQLQRDADKYWLGHYDVDEQESEWLSANEAAKRYHVHHNTVYKYSAAGKLITRKEGRRLLFSRASIEYVFLPATRRDVVK